LRFTLKSILIKEFETKVIKDLFEDSPQQSLIKDIGPRDFGIYALYHQEPLVYIGKTTCDTIRLRRRLNDHVKKIDNRENIFLSEMTCRYLIIEPKWLIVGLEDFLIKQFKPEWNGKGFGYRPGLDKRKTNITKWEQQFPLKISEYEHS